jgi:cytochrome c
MDCARRRLSAMSFSGCGGRRRVGDLFKVIKVTMPADRPSSLTDQDYADITAYILKMNKYPAGPKPLVTDRDALLLIAFERP